MRSRDTSRNGWRPWVICSGWPLGCSASSNAGPGQAPSLHADPWSISSGHRAGGVTSSARMGCHAPGCPDPSTRCPGGSYPVGGGHVGRMGFHGRDDHASAVVTLGINSTAFTQHVRKRRLIVCAGVFVSSYNRLV